jgi:hypothetical protein
MTVLSWVANDNVVGIKKWQYMQNDEILLHILSQT